MSHRVRIHLPEGRSALIPFPSRRVARIYVWWYKRHLRRELER